MNFLLNNIRKQIISHSNFNYKKKNFNKQALCVPTGVKHASKAFPCKSNKNKSL